MLHRKSGLLPAVPSAADRKNATKKAETNKTPDDNKNSLSQGRKFIGIGGHINSVNKFIILFVIKKLFSILLLSTSSMRVPALLPNPHISSLEDFAW